MIKALESALFGLLIIAGLLLLWFRDPVIKQLYSQPFTPKFRKQYWISYFGLCLFAIFAGLWGIWVIVLNHGSSP